MPSRKKEESTAGGAARISSATRGGGKGREDFWTETPPPTERPQAHMAQRAAWLALALVHAPGCHGLVPLVNALGKAGSRYAMLSTTHPMTTAAVTAGSILCAADLTCQCLLEQNKTSVDLRRTAALTIFGTWHYGVPAKALYLLYDQVLGTAPTLMNSIYKMLSKRCAASLELENQALHF